MKKFLIFFLSIVIAISLLSCVNQSADEPLPSSTTEASTTTAESTTTEKSTTTAATTTAAVTKKEGTPQNPLGDSFSGDNGEPPITVTFDSVQDIKPFIEVANGTSAKFEEYAAQKDLYYVIDQKVAQAMAHNMEIIDFPLISSKLTSENSGATYYVDRNELDVTYEIDGIRYRFIYSYNQKSIPDLSKLYPVIKQNVSLGNYSLDLYEANDRLGGYYLDNSILVHVIINTTDTSKASLDAFSMLPVASIK